MPRKFRLSVHRKNEFRKKRALKTDTKLKVSVPLSQISLLTAATIQQLQQRSKMLLKLPQGYLKV